eukprot:1449219-Pyramimonas_sp.AAC.1
MPGMKRGWAPAAGRAAGYGAHLMFEAESSKTSLNLQRVVRASTPWHIEADARSYDSEKALLALRHNCDLSRVSIYAASAPLDLTVATAICATRVCTALLHKRGGGMHTSRGARFRGADKTRRTRSWWLFVAR